MFINNSILSSQNLEVQDLRPIANLRTSSVWDPLQKLHYITKLITIAIIVLSSNSHAATITAEPSQFNNVSIIKTDSINDIINTSLMEKTGAQKLSITIKDSSKNITLNSKHDSFDVNIINATFNKKTRRFKYTLLFTADNDSQNVDIVGSYEEMVQVPVLRLKLASKTPITADQIEYIEQAKSKLASSTIMESSELVGKTLKHDIPENRPIRSVDIEKQILVSRGNNVNIIYKTPTMRLQAGGVAMDSGAKGELIRVRNSSSNKVIQGQIENNDTVMISSQE
jgi:flagella basal body P-ring formation protein FlgA